MDKIFEELIDAAPIIKEVFQEDTSIIIEDNEKILFVLEGETIKPPYKIGDKLIQNDLRDKVYKEKKAVYTILNKEEHGADLK